MSEFINARREATDFRRQLLTSVSAIALIGAVCIHQAKAATDDRDRPTIWLELGGQLEETSGGSEVFSPQFFSLASPANLDPMINAQRASRYSIGEEGKITFAPEDTNWVLSLAVRYGRSNTARHLHHETAVNIGNIYFGGHVKYTNFSPPTHAFGDAQAMLGSSHFVMDFQAGRDVGLGLFGPHGNSVFSAGVRFAQFTSSSDVTLHARPLFTDKPATSPGKYRIFGQSHATYTAVFNARRSTHAIGPSVSWAATAPVIGNDTGVTLAFDWGVNAAILFGRQRAHIHHQTTGRYSHKYGKPLTAVAKTGHYTLATNHDPARSVTIPNVGGFAGVSFRYLDASLKFGYRGDFFFGAMDNSIDTTKKSNVGFYGPFASISVGIGG